MRRFISPVLGLLFAALGFVGGASSAWAQPPQAEDGFRKLAAGVLKTIPPDVRAEETVSLHDLVEMRTQANLKWTPNFYPESQTLYAMSQNVAFRRPAECLELSFKPLRMIYVDIPQPSGKMQRKLIWYLVYQVRNVGNTLEPERKADGTYATKPANSEPRFFPQFVLESHEFKKAYLDRVIPVAVSAIQMREDPNRKLLNSVQISDAPIPVSADKIDKSVWGVATWEDVDPRIDFFSVYVQGLSNAYQWIDPPGVFQAGNPPGTGRRFTRKALQLNFWRPGDEFQEIEEEIRFGVAPGRHEMYGVEPGVDFRWVYR